MEAIMASRPVPTQRTRLSFLMASRTLSMPTCWLAVNPHESLTQATVH